MRRSCHTPEKSILLIRTEWIQLSQTGRQPWLEIRVSPAGKHVTLITLDPVKDFLRKKSSCWQGLKRKELLLHWQLHLECVKVGTRSQTCYSFEAYIFLVVPVPLIVEGPSVYATTSCFRCPYIVSGLLFFSSCENKIEYRQRRMLRGSR